MGLYMFMIIYFILVFIIIYCAVSQERNGLGIKLRFIQAGIPYGEFLASLLYLYTGWKL